MLDKNYSSKEWDKLWEEVENFSEISSYDKTQVAETKHIKSSDFGLGASMLGNFQNPVQGLQAEIRGGMGHIELSPDAVSGGSKGFGKVGEAERQALRELKEVNEISISTHAHPGITGLTGFNEREFRFDDRSREQGLSEIRKAIDFASEVAEGGSITFHAGEFTRPLAGQNWGKNQEEFQQSPEELKNNIFVVIDKEQKGATKEGMIRADERVVVPIFDYEAEKIPVSGLSGRSIPNYKTLNEGKNVQMGTFKNFYEYAAWAAKEDSEFKKLLKNKKITAQIKEDKDSKWGLITDYKTLELAALHKHKVDQEVGLARAADQNINQINRQLYEVEHAKKIVEKAKDKAKKTNQNLYLMKDMRFNRGTRFLSEEEVQAQIDGGAADATDFLKVSKDGSINKGETIEAMYTGDLDANNIDVKLSEIRFNKQNIQSELDNRFEKIDTNFATVSDFAEEQSKESFAQIGAELYQRNQELKKRKPDAEQMYFAVENLFPDKFGSTPTELIHVIKTAREGMAQGLQDQYNLEKKEAKKIAEQSIKATFDTGHLNMWKKYFKRKNGESNEAWHKRFNKWALSETEKLIKEGMIGNVHLADNYGYDDDHISIGAGNVPIKEYVEMFDRAYGEGKITGKIAVEAFDPTQEKHGVHEAWKATGMQMFRSMAATDSWVNPTSSQGRSYNTYQRHGGAYETNLHKPYFIFGNYAPNQEDWAPWDGLGLE